MLSVAVDIGGTFTDVVSRDENGRLRYFKVPTTRRDESVAVLQSIGRIVAEWGMPASAIERFTHGTTVATNAVLERRGAIIGLITTAGFRDVLEIGRQMRHQMYDLVLKPETPGFLAPGARRLEVRERIDAEGKVLVPLDEGGVRAAARALVDQGVEAIAICFLFSFANPAHERRARAIIEAEYPDLFIALSHEVDPAFREYERTVVTAFDAYVKPVIGRYLGRLEQGLAKSGVGAPLQVMQSRGGLMASPIARRRPVRLFLSGPAAGVIGARIAGGTAGDTDLITVDIGGTSCDIALISRGKALVRADGFVDGYPVRVPMVDVNSIGAGGGSIAWLDAAGGLRVGPKSAGSEPGPACYGRGGKLPTVTDASVVLGYIDPAYFAGGTLTLEPELAERAILETIAAPLGLSLHQAALGIHRVLNAQMAEGIRLVSIRQGLDPRQFALLPLGGGGAVHATALARELAISRIVVPRFPGVLSAAGLLVAPVEHEVSAAFGRPLALVQVADIGDALDRLDEQAATLMAQEALGGAAITQHYFADLCYIGQAYTIEVPLSLDDPAPLERLYGDFLELHARIYGHSTRTPARIVNLRSVHQAGGLDRIDEHAYAPAHGDPAKGMRSVLVTGCPDFVPAKVFDRAAMAAGFTFQGPAIVEQADTTTLVEPGWRGRVDDAANLILEREEGASHGKTGALPADAPRRSKLDPITVEVVRHKLEGIANEMESTLLRSSFSPIVKEGLDASACLFTVRGETLAQACAVPIHLATLIPVVQTFLREFPPGTMKDGDVYIMNDPYLGGTHLPDVALVTPVFHRGRLLALSAAMTHHQDVGGMTPGSIPTNATEIFQEGIRIPPLKLRDAGVMNDTLVKLLRLNVRIPDTFMGDINAQIACCQIGGRRLAELAGSMGEELLAQIFDELLVRSEAMTREALRAIPEGIYGNVDWLDNDGIELERRVRIEVAVTVKDGSIHIDFTGTSAQLKGPFNCVPSGSQAAAYFAIRALTDPTIPTNAGCFRPVSLHLPLGSLVNPVEPAAVGSRTATIKRIAGCILGAFKDVLPDRVPADSGCELLVLAFGGRRPSGASFVTGELIAAGSGAGRASDGVDVIETDASNCMNLPVEAMEMEAPIRVHRVALCRDSGGAGRQRGGLGIVKELETLVDGVTMTHRGERHYYPAGGSHGGLAGAKAHSVLRRASGMEEVIPSKLVSTMNRGDRLVVATAGGGGYGDPHARDRAALQEDVKNGKVGEAAAREIYGLVSD